MSTQKNTLPCRYPNGTPLASLFDVVTLDSAPAKERTSLLSRQGLVPPPHAPSAIASLGFGDRVLPSHDHTAPLVNPACWLVGVQFTANPVVVFLISMDPLLPVTVACGNILALQPLQQHSSITIIVSCLCIAVAGPTLPHSYMATVLYVSLASMLKARSHDCNLRLWGCTRAPKWAGKMHAIQHKQSGRCCVPFDLPFAFFARLTV
jgi:hypothetical protein